MSAERWIEIPDEGPRDLQDLAPESADAGGAPGACARYSGEDLLPSTRASPAGSHKPIRRFPRRFWQQAGRHQAPDYRDRCRANGARPSLCRADVRVGSAGLHGPGQLPAKPYRRLAMQTWGPKCSPARPTRPRPDARSSSGIPTTRLAGHRHLGSGRGGRGPRRYQLHARFGAQSCFNFTRPSSDSRRRSSSTRSGSILMVLGPCGGGSSFGGWRFRFLPTRQLAKKGRKPALRGGRGSSLSDAHQGRLCLRFWRCLGLYATDEDVPRP